MKFGNLDDDDSSSGQDSYISSCAQSYASFDDTDSSNLQYCNPYPNPKSYAEAVLPKMRASPTVQEVCIAPPVDANIQQFRDKISGLEAELAALKIQFGQQTPSTVTEGSTPGVNTRMDKFESTMMDFKDWMKEMVTIMRDGPRSPPHSPFPVHTSGYQPSKRTQDSSAHPPQFQYTHTTRHIDSPSSHQSKWAVTRHTPEKGDPMLTQPTEYDPSTQLFSDQASRFRRYPRKTTGYNPAEPEQIYHDNGDGRLFAVGLAGPQGYDSQGIRRRCHHPDSQPATPTKGHPSLTRLPQLPVTESPQRLPAEGAQTHHA